mmetsp:Transcript_27696/g.92650  ORF Transcript_27696/g.92650 Transcript_27696/m.92650 type:complete len:227 (+) Transcript_27696:639-1319(+)
MLPRAGRAQGRPGGQGLLRGGHLRGEAPGQVRVAGGGAWERAPALRGGPAGLPEPAHLPGLPEEPRAQPAPHGHGHRRLRGLRLHGDLAWLQALPRVPATQLHLRRPAQAQAAAHHGDGLRRAHPVEEQGGLRNRPRRPGGLPLRARGPQPAAARPAAARRHPRVCGGRDARDLVCKQVPLPVRLRGRGLPQAAVEGAVRWLPAPSAAGRVPAAGGVLRDSLPVAP